MIPGRTEISIGELVVEGLAPSARRALADAVEGRLGELVAERGAPVPPRGRRELDALEAPLGGPWPADARTLGAGVAEAVYRALPR